MNLNWNNNKIDKVNSWQSGGNHVRRIRDFSIKWKVFCYFAVFCFVMLLILWLFQVMLLEDFYKGIKTSSIKQAAETIDREIQNQDSTLGSLGDTIMNVAQKNDVCIMVIDSAGMVVQTAELSPACVIHHLPYKDLYSLILSAKDNGGTLLYRIDFDKKMREREKIEGNVDDDTRAAINNITRQPSYETKSMPESIIYIKVVTDSRGKESAILVNSNITPVDATVQTLRIQLFFIMGIMLVVALVLALLISRRIAKPIIKINNSSKALAKGNYGIDFICDGYKEIVELGESLNYAASELGKTEKFQRELIANISHDLRTPLTMITGYGEVMRDLPGENTAENVQVIIDEANRLTTLVNDMLDLSKLQSGTQVLDLSQYNLTKSIHAIIDRLSKLLAEEGYRITFEYQEEIWVIGDELKLSQVVYNLLTNAITYTGDDKSILVKQQVLMEEKRKAKEKDKGRRRVRIDVIDHGEGIAEDKIKDIWQRYYKLDKSHKRAQVGTGLGLSIVRNVLDMHQASYGVESKVNEGSDFWFEMDLVDIELLTPEIDDGDKASGEK